METKPLLYCVCDVSLRAHDNLYFSCKIQLDHPVDEWWKGAGVEKLWSGVVLGTGRGVVLPK